MEADIISEIGKIYNRYDIYDCDVFPVQLFWKKFGDLIKPLEKKSQKRAILHLVQISTGTTIKIL